ncbi:hypothetical protein NDN08_005218 [Rhodosorus marinus]|uniref:Carbohydrate binding module family 25 domain-containing protein n=1 Tax=Rhodosorus marinus TaxID=101924 RepID=A0AAV8V0X3_9RHOD|nr:hypothetical protein NDN08_005218 [Rhodosorus marinus]
MPEPGDFGWIEVFHSLPSWKRAFIVFRKDDGEWVSNATYELVSADHVRPGFRVFRVKARKLEFYITNGSKSNWDDNKGGNYHVGMPGRYICGQNVFTRVGDADEAECERFLNNKDIRINFSTTERCLKMFCLYRMADGEFTPAPGQAMMKSVDGNWTITLPVRATEVAFTDSMEFWDSNLSKNYKLGSPGSYFISNGVVELMKEETPNPYGFTTFVS